MKILCAMGFHDRRFVKDVTLARLMRCRRCGQECLEGRFAGHFRCR